MSKKIKSITAIEESSEVEEMPVHFSGQALDEEIERGAQLRVEQCKHQHEDSCRIYTREEQQFLSVELQDYLQHLEKQGSLTPLQREWVLESVMITATARRFNTVPKSLLVATVFVVQGLDAIFSGIMPLTWRQQQEVSSRLH